MTVLIKDAKDNLEETGVQLTAGSLVQEKLYADDTQLIDADSTVVAAYMHAVSRAGAVYGLTFNWEKLEALPINCSCDITDLNGKPLKQNDRIVYLGSLIDADGSGGSELNRRIGAARDTFPNYAGSGAMRAYQTNGNWKSILHASSAS